MRRNLHQVVALYLDFAGLVERRVENHEQRLCSEERVSGAKLEPAACLVADVWPVQRRVFVVPLKKAVVVVRVEQLVRL